MHPQQRVAHSIRHILWCAGLGLAAAVPAAAQEPAADQDEAGMEEVVVTGSRVRNAEPVGSSVIALDREAITASAEVTVDRIIKEIPQNFDLGVSENSRAQSGGAGNIVYSNTVNLRGIGPYATLVLVDGHRVTNNTRSTDPSVIPSLAVQRIEVVADGASAIYGSDAVAGVVNIIPRRTLDGVEVMGRTTFADTGNYSDYIVGAAWGKVFDRGQVMLAFEHYDRTNLASSDREFFGSDQRRFGGNDYRINRCNPGTLRIGTTTYAMPAGGLTPANAASLTPGTQNLCDDRLGQDLFPEQQYNSGSTTFTYEITDRLTLFGDGFYSKREFERLPAFATGTLNVPQTNAWFVRPPGFAGTSYFVEYGFENDLPRNASSGSAESWQLTPGLRIGLPGDWQMEAVFGIGETRDDSNEYGGLNTAALNAALASSNPATAFDPYGLGRTSPATLDAISDQIFFAPTYGDFKGYELRANGTLFTLPGGNVGLAAGFERQDIDVALGSARGGPTTPIDWRYFGRDVDSGYVEVSVPIVGAGNERAGIHRLTVNAAVRYDDYSDVGDTTNVKYGITYRPSPTLALRGSYGTSFRAPLITQIYGNSSLFRVGGYQNPLGGPAVQVVTWSGPNLNLRPEEATTWSVGVDWEPLANLSLALTYFNVDYRNQVESLQGQTGVLSREADYAGTGIILRGAAAGARVLELLAQGVPPPTGTWPGGSPGAVPLFIDTSSQNLSKSLTTGVDFQAAWRLLTDSLGRFTFTASGSYLTNYEVAVTSIATPADRLNQIFNPLRLKSRAGVSWEGGDYRAGLTLTYVNGYKNTAVLPASRISAYTPVDLTFGWDMGALGWSVTQDLQLGVEVRNAFDEDPPYVNIAPGMNGSGGYDATASNPIGRVFGVSLRKKW